MSKGLKEGRDLYMLYICTYLIHACVLGKSTVDRGLRISRRPVGWCGGREYKTIGDAVI